MAALDVEIPILRQCVVKSGTIYGGLPMYSILWHVNYAIQHDINLNLYFKGNLKLGKFHLIKDKIEGYVYIRHPEEQYGIHLQTEQLQVLKTRAMLGRKVSDL
jgi:hypothetical protein